MSKGSKLVNNDIPNETTWCKDISNQKSGADLGEQKGAVEKIFNVLNELKNFLSLKNYVYFPIDYYI
jgi:hypothetical protein